MQCSKRDIHGNLLLKSSTSLKLNHIICRIPSSLQVFFTHLLMNTNGATEAGKVKVSYSNNET